MGHQEIAMPSDLESHEPTSSATPDRADRAIAAADDFEPRRFCGVTVSACTQTAAIDHLKARIAAREKTLLAYANTNLLNAAHASAALRDDLADFLVLNDGVGLDIASKYKYGRGFPANLNGTDFTPALMRACAGHSVYLYGAAPQSVAGAAERFAAMAITIAGYDNGYIGDDPALIDRINASGADILLVALGNPKQERWIHANRNRVAAPLMVGVGALFDFVSGEKRRAPQWVQSLRLEWLARLVQEPRRLTKRYTVDVAWFFLCVMRETWAEHKAVNQ